MGCLCEQTATPAQLAAGVVAGAALQGALAAPFLAAAPASYAGKAFELSRVFLHRWTVNLKFLPEDVFQRWHRTALVNNTIQGRYADALPACFLLLCMLKQCSTMT